MADKLLSRRDFIKSAGAGGAALFLASAGIFTGSKKVESVVDDAMYWDSVINFGSGVDSKRRTAKFNEVIEKSVDNPKILSSYLKWMAIEIYATVNNLVLSQKTASHFLYGDGKELDLSQKIIDSIRLSPGWLDIPDPEITSDRNIAKAFVEETVLESVMYGDPVVTPKIKQIEDSFMNGNRQIEIKGTGDKANEDFFSSIRRFYFKYQGVVKSVDNGIANTKGEFHLSDKYDWDERIYDGSSLTVSVALEFMETFLSAMGISSPKEWLKSRMDQNEYQDLIEKRIITISDADGLLLQQSGVGKAFPIVAKFEVSNLDIKLD